MFLCLLFTFGPFQWEKGTESLHLTSSQMVTTSVSMAAQGSDILWVKGGHFRISRFILLPPPRLIVLHVGPITLCFGPSGQMSLTLEPNSPRKWNHMFSAKINSKQGPVQHGCGFGVCFGGIFVVKMNTKTFWWQSTCTNTSCCANPRSSKALWQSSSCVWGRHPSSAPCSEEGVIATLE